MHSWGSASVVFKEEDEEKDDEDGDEVIYLVDEVGGR
jgi:hypothetical protein